MVNMRFKPILHNFILCSCPISNLKTFEKYNKKFIYSMSTNKMYLEQSKIILKNVFYAGIKAVLPRAIIQNNVKIQENILYIKDKSFVLQENVYLVGFGKAVMGMAIALEQILGDRLKKGIVSIPDISKRAIWMFDDKSNFPKLDMNTIEYREGAVNNQPDNRSLDTTHHIIDLLESLTETDTLLILVSGGGSALLYMPRPIIDPEDKLHLCKSLQNAGADIIELNTVRKKLSLVKGGGLARIAYPATVVTLILSDIVGDPVDLIASGPTVYSPKVPEDVIGILRKYNLYDSLEGDLKTVLTSKETFDDTPLLNSAKEFKHATNIILANNNMAIEAAREEVLRQKLTPIILRNDVTGNVRDVSMTYAHVVSLICLALERDLMREEFFERVKNIPILSLPGSKVDEIYDLTENIDQRGLVLIGGGEPTVVVNGSGKGGRNQELALHFSLDWLTKIKSNPQIGKYEVIMLSAGTDGQDGPTDAAGAFGYPAIGPIVHDLYKQIKSMILKESIAMKQTETVETKDNGETLGDLCKKRELSFPLPHKKELDNSKAKEGKPEISNVNDIQKREENIRILTLTAMEIERMLPENTLKENDTYNFFSRFNKGADLFKTGFTDTNVMDLHLIYIQKRNCGCKIHHSPKEQLEPCLNDHDLHIDPSTIKKYETINAPLTFEKGLFTKKEFLYDAKTEEHLNITLIDESLGDVCCDKTRKFSDNPKQ